MAGGESQGKSKGRLSGFIGWSAPTRKGERSDLERPKTDARGEERT